MIASLLLAAVLSAGQLPADDNAAAAGNLRYGQFLGGPVEEPVVEAFPDQPQLEPWPGGGANVVEGDPYFEPLDAGFEAEHRLIPRFGASWLAPGGYDGFGTADIDLGLVIPWHVAEGREPILVAPGFGLHSWAGPGWLDLPPRVYDVYLDFSWRFLDRGHWGLTGGITPGFYGDFHRIDGKTFQLTGWLLGNYRMNEQWNLLGGLAYVRQLKSNLLPIGGLVWTPNDATRVEILVPRPRIARRLRDDGFGETWGYVAGQFGGGAWAVDDGPGQNVLVGYSDLRLLLGMEFLRLDGLEAAVEVGYVFSRDISIDNHSIGSPSDTVLLQANLAF